MIDFRLLKSLIKGILTFIPGVNAILRLRKIKSEHSCSDAYFCYNLWLRIIVSLNEKGFGEQLSRIGEIGNGRSLGVGLCALLSGSKEYFSFEIDNTFDSELNIKLLDDLIVLFRRKTPISDQLRININVNNLEYPDKIIKQKYLDNYFVEEIRKDILSGPERMKIIHIINDWQNYSSLGLNLIFSRAVMEHVANPSDVYQSAVFHLVEDGIMIHDIELHSHGITTIPDGHYDIPDCFWRIIFGKREYFLNRWNLCDHIDEIRKLNCQILATELKSFNYKSGRQILTGASLIVKKAG